MKPSIVRLINGRLDESRQHLTLIVAIVTGEPQVGEMLFLEDHNRIVTSVIESISSHAKNDSSEVILTFYSENAAFFSEWTMTIITNLLKKKAAVVCSLQQSVFRQLPIKQKLAYVLALVQLLAGDTRLPRLVEATIQPAVHFSAGKPQSPAGPTKFGGLPLAPKGFAFAKGSNGKSAVFIGQFHIGELKLQYETCKQLRGNGILYLFAEMNSPEQWSWDAFSNIIVQYTEQVHALTTIDQPNDIPEDDVFVEKTVTGREDYSIPDDASSLWEGDWSQKEIASFQSVDAILPVVYSDQYDSNARFPPAIQFLGHLSAIDECLLLEAEMKQAGQRWYPSLDDWHEKFEKDEEWRTLMVTKAKNWRHLCTVDPEFLIGLCNREAIDEKDSQNNDFKNLDDAKPVSIKYFHSYAYVMILEEDFVKMNFERTVTIFQHL